MGDGDRVLDGSQPLQPPPVQLREAEHYVPGRERRRQLLRYLQAYVSGANIFIQNIYT